MPIGIIVNALSVAIGGILGALIGGKLSDSFKEKLNMVFGACSMAMGIRSIPMMENMPAVILSIIVGTIIGMLIHFEQIIHKGALLMNQGFSKIIRTSPSNVPHDEYMATFLTIIVLFCSSGTGIYGSIISGMTGDHSILIAKSILDLFTAMIFACILGPSLSLVAIPQFLIFLILFLLADLIYPHTTPVMIADFNACGGILLLATGFRMIKVKMFPIADMIPAMAIVMPISYFWTSVIIPLIG